MEGTQNTTAFLQKTYEVRPGTINLGREYEFKVTALVCLRCISQNVSDMWIASNLNGVGAFDDIVLQIRIAQNVTTYMVQLKHRKDCKNIAAKEFFKPKEDFSLERYFQDVADLQKILEADTKPTGNCDLGAFSNIYFILFTNRNAPDHPFLVKHTEAATEFLNSDHSTGTAYRFDIQQLTKTLNLGNPDLYENVRLLTNQIHNEHIEEKIVEELHKITKAMKISTCHLKEVGEKFTHFVADWTKGQLGGHYYLTKSDLICKLTELFCKEYELNLSSEKYSYFYCEQNALWDEIVQKKILTVVESNQRVLSFLKQYIGSAVRRCCDKSGPTWMYTLSEKAQKAFYGNNEDLEVQMLKIIGNQGSSSLLDIYKCLWMCHKVPLLLQIKNKKEYKNVLRILELSNFNYKVIVLTSSEEDLPSKAGKIKCFNSLLDLDIEDQGSILKQTIKLQGREGATLNSIVDEANLKCIKCSDIIDVLRNDFNIGDKLNVLPDYFIGRSITKVFLRMQVLQKVKDEVFLIKIDSEEDHQDLLKYSLGVYKFEDVNESTMDDCHIITTTKLEAAEESLPKNKIIHALSVYDKDHLEWICSSGSIEKITTFQADISIFTEDIDKEEARRVNILCAAPGMGKSLLMDYIAQKTPPHQWVLRINLNLYQKYYRSKDCKDPSTEATKHLEYFYNALCGDIQTNKRLAWSVFQKLATTRNIVILMDGFDEISAVHKQSAFNVAKSFHRAGYKLWLTTRPVMKAYLESQFNTFALFLKPFSTADQKDFLIKYFGTLNSDLTPGSEKILNAFVDRLLQAAKANLSDTDAKFTGIPLQSKLLADYFNTDCRNCLSKKSIIDFNTNFDLLCLYQNFIDTKIDILCSKHGDAAEEMRFMFEEHQSLFALKLVFSLDMEESVFKDLDRYYKDNPDKIQLFQRDGIIMIDNDCDVTVVHRTFAEYLAAMWLSQNYKSKEDVKQKICKNLLSERFTQNYKFLFNVFDRLIAKGCAVHLDIINGNIGQARRVMDSNPDSLSSTDSGGRSILHVIALNGVQFPELFDQNRFTNEALTFLRRKMFLKDEALITIRSIPNSRILPIKDDLFGYSIIDYALANRSIAVANQLCSRYPFAVINAYIDPIFKHDYLSYCAELGYKSLFKSLLVYFASRDLLMLRTNSSTSVLKYSFKCLHADSFWYNQNQFAHKAFLKDVLEEFEERNILQMLQSEIGYPHTGYSDGCFKDLRYAVAFGSKENVTQLLSVPDKIDKEDVDGNVPLHYAVLHGKLDNIEMLLNKGVTVNKQNRNRNTPLHLAFLKYKKNIIQLLLSKDVDVNLTNDKGETVINYAAENGYEDELLHLLSKNANINKQDDCGYTPLHRAVTRKQIKIVGLLLDKGANVNLTDMKGDSPLCHAVKKGYVDITEVLLNSGADINQPDGNGNSLLHFSLNSKNVTMTKLLLSYDVDVNTENNRGETALFCAIFRGYTDIVAELLKMDADINKRSRNGCTILHSLLKNGQVDAAEMVISLGADVNMQTNNEDTALHYAILYCEQAVGQIIVSGADINSTNSNGDTPLHLALRLKNKIKECTISRLLAIGASVNEQNRDGETAIHYACKYNSSFLTEIISKGADVNKRDCKGRTPLFHCGYDSPRIKLLASNGANINEQDNSGDTLLHLAVSNSNIDFVKFLISEGANINAINEKGETALHLSLLRKNYLPIIKELLSSGADVNKQDIQGNTPLLLALRHNHKDAAELLVTSGTDVNISNNNDYTPLQAACDLNSKHIIELLITLGANVNHQDEHGNTVLHWAAEKNIPNVIALILSKGADAYLQNDLGNTPFHLAVRRLPNLQMLIDKFPNFDQKNNNGNTVLHLAVQENLSSVVKRLIWKDPYVNKRRIEDETSHSSSQSKEGTTAFQKLASIKNNCGATALHIALKNNNLEIVQLLIINDADLNDQNEEGNTVLHWAVDGQHFKFVALLMTKGADVNRQNSSGNTPLHLATVGHHMDIVEILMSNGANVDIANSEGKTMLHYIVECGESKIGNTVLSKGTMINKQDANGDTSLHLALRSGNVHAVNLLFKKGADCTKQNSDGDTPLHLAVTHRYLDVIQSLLLKDADVNKQNTKGATALHYSAATYRKDITDFLLSKGAVVNDQDVSGETPLHIASRHGDADAVKLLLSYAADVNVQNNQAATPLFQAVSNGFGVVASILLSSGAHINQANCTEDTPLHIAVKRWSKHNTVVNMLLDKGADTNKQNCDGDTPLHNTSRMVNDGGSIVVKLLLSHGADVNIKNKLGDTAKEQARKKNELEILAAF